MRPSEIVVHPASIVLAVALAFLPKASAATHCVNPSGTGGCSSTITAAVSAAGPNDTIRVYQGTYKEDVVIGKPLSLVGTDAEHTIVDAKGMSNGFYVDGLDNPGLANVTITGFTVKNANFEGIAVTNATSITIWGNRVLENDKSLNINAGECPGTPAWETEEGDDCGEGIHISGVSGSVIAKNLVQHNAGGILISDDSGATHDNIISGNWVLDNVYDCGITLASHPPATSTGSMTPLGVYRNTIVDNQSSGNGVKVPGAGAGVGIFDGANAAQNYSNVVVHNVLTKNGIPGVAMHSHGPGQVMSGNVIIGNYIAGNHEDTTDSATPGSTGVNVFGVSPATGTIVMDNIIRDEKNAVVVNTGAQVDVLFNSFVEHEVGVNNIGPGSANATENWWGCAKGPTNEECASVNGPNIWFTPWLTHPF